jgi:hypothetical protein
MLSRRRLLAAAEAWIPVAATVFGLLYWVTSHRPTDVVSFGDLVTYTLLLGVIYVLLPERGR